MTYNISCFAHGSSYIARYNSIYNSNFYKSYYQYITFYRICCVMKIMIYKSAREKDISKNISLTILLISSLTLNMINNIGKYILWNYIEKSRWHNLENVYTNERNMKSYREGRHAFWVHGGIHRRMALHRCSFSRWCDCSRISSCMVLCKRRLI